MSADIAGYQVFQDDKKFAKAVQKLPARIQEALKEKIRFLADNPSHNSLNTKPYKCQGQQKRALEKEGITDVREFYINAKKYRCVFYVLHEQQILYLAYVGLHGQLENWAK